MVLDIKGGLDVRDAVIARVEGADNVGDLAVDDVYALLGDSYNYWRLCHFRDSLDDHGMRLVAAVHAEVDFENAIWANGLAIIGDGGQIFHPFTTSPTAVYQLVATGVLDHLVALDKSVEAAALRIGCANIFACLTEQFTLLQTAAAASWMVGAGLFRSPVVGMAIYSLVKPGSANPFDSQAAYLDAGETTPAVLAGIPAHAFYRFATTLGGYAWETPARVWYATLTDPRAVEAWQAFTTFAELTTKVADELFGPDLAAASMAAWGAVGVLERDE